MADLTHQWPPCVFVEHLCLKVRFSLSLMENFISLPSSVRELEFLESDVRMIYAALQKLGPELTTLQLYHFSFFEHTPPIDLYKVLAACPKLEYFFFSFGNLPVLPKNMSESAILPSNYFQNFKRFRLEKIDDYGIDSNEVCLDALLHLFRMFLLGSRNMRILDVQSDSGFLDIVLDVLETNPTYFDKLEEIRVDVYNTDDAILVKILEVADLLIFLSSCMKIVTFRFYDKEWIASAYANAVYGRHCWFFELVNALNIRFCCTHLNEVGPPSKVDMQEFTIL